MKKKLLLFIFLLINLISEAQSIERLSLVSATPSFYTGQDYTPWLNDNLEDLVQGTWGNNDPNNRYIDVNVKLAKKSVITKISLYDVAGQFPADHLTSIYVLNGTDSTFVGTFDGASYMAFVDYAVDSLVADAIVIHKYGNDIPQKVRAYGFKLPDPPAGRLSLVSAIPNVATGQDYTPWLNDNMDDFVQGTWGNNDPNNRYVDVRVQLAKKSQVTKVSLYDVAGQFPADHLTSIYLVNGSDSTFVGTFDGSSYMAFVDYPVDTLLADAIIIRKFGNDIPQKVRAYGYETEETTSGPASSIITFAELGTKMSNDAPFDLVASSNNTESAITFSSSDPSIVSVANTSGSWKATLHKAGTVTITASQAASEHYTVAANVARTLVVNAPVDNSERLTIASIIPNEFTGQDYSPWLNDNLDSLVQGTFGHNDPNRKYVDVTLWLEKTSKITKLSLYDIAGQFPADHITSIYTVKGNDSTFVGTFDGSSYMTFIDYHVDSVIADAIVIRKFGNDIPQKVKIYGFPLPITDSAAVRINSVISFAELPAKTTADAPFTLTATSNNAELPIEFESSNPSVVSVSNVNGVWKAAIHNDGTVTIIAKQAGNDHYIPAMPILRSLLVTRSVDPPAPEVVITSPIIPLDPKRWYTMDNNISLDGLMDGIASPEVSVVRTGKMRPVFESYYPLRDGETFSIDAIRQFDGLGMEPDSAKYMRLYVITDTWERKLIGTFSGKNYMVWTGPNSDRPNDFYLDSIVTDARYLLIRGNGMFPTELELHGTYNAGVAPTAAVKKPVKLKEMFAVNGFEWDFEDLSFEIPEGKLKAAKTFTGFRHYMEWNKLEGDEGKYTFNPTRAGGWNFDAVYEKCKEEGIEVLGCIKGIPDWMRDTYPPDGQDTENVPVKYGKDLSDPNSYLEQARVAFQYAARYGSNKNVDKSLLSVNGTPRWNFDPINVVKVGMDLVKYIECDNERDKTWKLYGYQTGREYAANLSAYYDGHKNTMGPGVGVKNADPNMKVAMCGIASVETDYVRGMVDWCKEFRGYNADGTVNLCWDIVNYHAYSNDGKTSQSGTYTRGSAPEIGGLGEVADDFIQMSHEYSKDMEVWVTETGYDLSPGSPLRAIPIGDKSAEQVQADWILRTSLLYARHGIKRCFFYLMYDQSVMENFTQFATSGLIRNTDLSRKPAGDFIYQTNQLFGEYVFQESLNADPIVDRYQLNGKSMYTLYVPDETGRTANYTLNLAGMDSAYVYKPLAASDTMQVQKIKLTDGQLPLLVTETPVFVVGVEAPRQYNTYTWTGTVSTEPDKVGNWMNTVSGVTTELPNQESTLIIPAGLSRYPVMNAVFAAKQITIAQGASWSLNGYSFTLTGNIVNNGSILNNDIFSSTVIFSGKDTTQVYTGNTNAGSSKISKLILENPHGLTLAGGPLNIYESVKVVKGSLNANGLLNLKATANGYSSILALPSGSAINGNVNVEVYITGGTASYRGTRGLSTPINDYAVTGAKSLQQLKNYVVVTGVGGATNGFDPGGASQPYAASLTRYNEPVSNAQYNFLELSSIYETFKPGTGVFLYYRGDRTGYTPETSSTSNKVNSPFAIPENTIVTYTGPINQGNVTVPLSYTYHDGEGAYNGLNFVGNPYPCAIDWSLVTRVRMNNVIKIIKAGGGVATMSDGVTSNAGQIDMRYIQPGQGFYVQGYHRDSSLITFTEACKVGGRAFVGRFMSAPLTEGLLNGEKPATASNVQLLRLLLSDDTNSEETVIGFKESGSELYKAADGDASYIGANSVYLSSLTADGKEMTINFMPALEKVKEIKLNVNSNTSGTVKFTFTELPGNNTYWLKDNYSNSIQEVKQNQQYEFAVDKSKAETFGANRFAILLNQPDAAEQKLDKASVQVYPNPADDIIHVSLGAGNKNCKIIIYNLAGQAIKSLSATLGTTAVNISSLSSGTYIVQVQDLSTKKIITSTKIIKK